MPAAKIAITIEASLLKRIDQLVSERRFPNRSQAVQDALREKLDRLDKGRLARECAKLDPAVEKRMAEEGMAWDLDTWPEY